MSKNHVNDGYINSSYTVLFLVFTIAYSLYFSFAFNDATAAALFAILGYALVSYFVWEVIRQLFYPGQALFLGIIIQLFLPVLMNVALQYPLGTIAVAIYVASTFSALIVESVYEKIAKKYSSKLFFQRLLMMDGAIDKSFLRFSNKHIQLTEWRGFLIGLGLLVLYAAAILFLLHR